MEWDGEDALRSVLPTVLLVALVAGNIVFAL